MRFRCSIRESRFQPFGRLVFIMGVDPLGKELVQALSIPWPDTAWVFGDETPAILDGMTGRVGYEKVVDLLGAFYEQVDSCVSPTPEMVESSRVAKILLRWGRTWPDGVFQVREEIGHDG